MKIEPVVASSRPAISRSSVLLPQPDGPTSTSSSPSWISNEASAIATNPFG
jgi:hypothetical protein